MPQAEVSLTLNQCSSQEHEASEAAVWGPAVGQHGDNPRWGEAASCLAEELVVVHQVDRVGDRDGGQRVLA